VTPLTHRLGEVIGFPEFSEGVKVKLESPEETKTLHPRVLVKRIDGD
jgi:hypothetical protein